MNIITTYHYDYYFYYYSLHALGRLPGDVDELDHLKLGLDDVQVVVEARTLAPLGYNGQLRLGGVAHEQQDVHVACFPGGGNNNNNNNDG